MKSTDRSYQNIIILTGTCNLVKIKRRFIISLSALVLMHTICLAGEELHILKNKDFTVFFEPQLGVIASEVAAMYPDVKADLEKAIGWNLNLSSSVLLLKDRRHFQRIAESPLTVAFAVPAKNLIVIDCTKVNIRPFTLEMTLKHELCHLMLHQHIRGPVLPRWLDEGFCQWVSDGIGDIIMDQKRSLLNRAALLEELIPLKALETGFPQDGDTLLLAYEESKSFVADIIHRFGKGSILQVFEHMKNGQDLEVAILESLSISLEKLEKEWHDSLRKKMPWFAYLSYQLYEILFALMGLIMIYAFIKILIRKKNYVDEETKVGPFS